MRQSQENNEITGKKKLDFPQFTRLCKHTDYGSLAAAKI